MQTFFMGKGKLSHLIRLALSEDNPKFFTWDEEESMILSWLWNSMQPEISECYNIMKSL